MIDCISRCVFSYVVMDASNQETNSEQIVRCLSLGEAFSAQHCIQMMDTWQDLSNPYAVITHEAFRKAIGFEMSDDTLASARDARVPRCLPQTGHIVIRFVIRNWMCRRSEEVQLYVTGGLPSLGNWQQDKVFAMTSVGLSTWEGEVLVPEIDLKAFTYKYALRNEKGLVLESGESRLASLLCEHGHSEQLTMIVLEDGHFRHEKLWKGTGVAVPVFSLRSERGVGGGEFSDLKLLVDLCVRFGFDVIQLLPVNDTRVHGMWWDSYPYSSLSVFALHPIYLRIDTLLEDPPKRLVDAIEEARDQLNGSELDYDATLKKKMELARAIYQLHGKETLKVWSSFGPVFREECCALVHGVLDVF